MMVDTIYALATPPGGAIAVIRASGPLVAGAAKSLTGRDLLQTPRMMAHVRLTHGGEALDDAMAACFCAPRSYTGEDMLELYCHGSQAVIRTVLAALSALGLRPAEPGELTRRAFLGGKMDLIQAEAVMDLVQAEASLSARAALSQLEGRLRREIDSAEAILYDALSAVNAAIDYPEELEDDVFRALPQQLDEAAAALDALVSIGMRGRALRDGFRVTLLGAPNAGKSSLLNALVGYERAIVTHEPGATRDTLEETILLDGIPVHLIDTAGLREAKSEAERLGVIRARDAIKNADAMLLLLDGADTLPDMHAFEPLQNNTLLLRTKADLPAKWAWEDVAYDFDRLDVSAKTGAGLSALTDWIKARVGPVGDAYVTNARHIAALQGALASIRQAMGALDADSAATDIRDALTSLGGITGRAVDDTVIDRIFERFCVGK